jgi:hypothetical protein
MSGDPISELLKEALREWPVDELGAAALAEAALHITVSDVPQEWLVATARHARRSASAASNALAVAADRGTPAKLEDVAPVLRYWLALEVLVRSATDESPDLDEEAIRGMTIDELHTLVIGLPATPENIAMARLCEVLGPDHLSDALGELRRAAQSVLAGDPDAAEGLAALAAVIDLTAAAQQNEDERLFAHADEQANRARSFLPSAAAPVVGPALQGRLRLPATDDGSVTQRLRDVRGAGRQTGNRSEPAPAETLVVIPGESGLIEDVETSLAATSHDAINVEPHPVPVEVSDSGVFPAPHFDDTSQDSATSAMESGAGGRLTAQSYSQNTEGADSADRPAARLAQYEGASSEPPNSGSATNTTTSLPGQELAMPPLQGLDSSIDQAAWESVDSEDRTATSAESAALTGVPDTKATQFPSDLVEPAELLTALASEGRWALAHWAIKPVNGAAADAYAAAAFAEAVTGPTGLCAREFATVCERFAASSLAAHRGALVAGVAAALRVALIAPLAGAERVLADALGVFASCPQLVALIEAVRTSSAQGIDVAALSAEVADVALADQQARAAAAEAVQFLGAAPQRRIKFHRATKVWQDWTGSSGLLSTLLEPVVRDDRSAVDAVRSRVQALWPRGAIDRAIADADPGSRARRDPIEAGARSRLIDWLQETLAIANRWADAASRFNAGTTAGHSWRHAHVLDLRNAVRAGIEPAIAELSAWADQDPVAAAHVAGAAHLLRGLSALCDGSVETRYEPYPADVLATDLLASADIPFCETTNLPLRDPTLAEVANAAAASKNPAAWFEARASRHDHVGTGLVVEALRRAGQHGRAIELAAERDRRLDRAVEAASSHRVYVIEQLARARRQGLIDEDTWTSLTATVEAQHPQGRNDLDRLRNTLRDVESEITRAHDRELAAFVERLDAVAATSAAVASRVTRIRALAAAGDLTTATEALLLAEDGKDLPDVVHDSPLEEFLGAINSPPASFDSRAVVAAREGGSWGPFTFETLPPATRKDVAEAFEAWSSLVAASHNGDWARVLRPLLRLAGIEMQRLTKPTTPAGSDRVWLDLESVSRTGKALVPVFGSSTGDRLRVLVALTPPRVKLLIDWVDQDRSNQPILVLHPGTLTGSDRRELARVFRAPQRRRAVAVIDDAVVGWLGQRGGRRFEDLMRVTLPWTAHNPYTPNVLGLVPPEMFYGRAEAVRSVIEPTGTSFIYGGRQLGKSALLRAAERTFEEDPNQIAVYVDLYSENIGRTRPAAAVWEVLWRLCSERGVVTGKAPTRDVATAFSSKVLAWLSADPRRRLLLLLDEADRFLDADAAVMDSRSVGTAMFSTVAQIRRLMELTQRRCKVVLAGLHTVQRFVGLPNEPLTNMANPIQVGPLEPVAAYDLVTRPLDALGYRFATPDLANRVVAYCNFFPSLLQLFCAALSLRLLDTPLPHDAPPLEITADAIEAVYASTELAEAFRHRLNLTLGLDEAYLAIAYTIALEAMGTSVDRAVPVAMLKERCAEVWPAGFATTSADQFRHLCDELCGLGVLARVAQEGASTYRLRSPNVLRMLGTMDTVLDKLIEVSTKPAPSMFAASTGRARLRGGGCSPLTGAQTAELLSVRSQTLVVVGARATGTAQVAEALRDAAGTSVEVLEATRGSRSRLRPDNQRHRIHVLSVTPEELPDVLRTADQAMRQVPRGMTMAVALLVDASEHDVVGVFTDPRCAGRLVTIGPLDKHAVQAWAAERQLHPWADDAGATQLLEATGGFIQILDAAEASYAESRKGPTALGKVLARLREPGAAAQLARDCGVHGQLSNLLGVAIAFGEQSFDETLAAAATFAAVGDPHGAVEALLALGVLERSEMTIRPVPVLTRVWTDAHPDA